MPFARCSNNTHGLDDVMRSLYHDFYIAKGSGFTEEEYWEVCARFAGQPMTEICEYVETTKEIDYVKYLGYAGIEIVLTPFAEQDGSPVVKSSWQMSFRDEAQYTPLQLNYSECGFLTVPVSRVIRARYLHCAKCESGESDVLICGLQSTFQRVAND